MPTGPRHLNASWQKLTPHSANPKPHPSKPHPCNMPQAKTEVALQFSECCAAETALQHRLFCSAEVIWTRSCAARNEKLHCNIEKAALQESGAFLPLFCGVQAPTFRHPRLGSADPLPLGNSHNYPHRNCFLKCLPDCLSPTRECFFLFQNCPRGEGKLSGNKKCRRCT